MRIWRVLWGLARRWYLVAFVFALGLAGSAVAVQLPGVYWSRAEVTFLAPTSAIYPNTLPLRSSDLVITAGIIAKLINGNTTWIKTADPYATIVGKGVYDGWTVRLPDYGGQWTRNYPRQVLEIQVSGPSEEVVRQRRHELIDRIDAELAGLQADVVVGDRITTTVEPASPPVYYFRGSRARALAMIWVLTGATVVLLEYRNRRLRLSPHRSHRAPSARPAGPGEPSASPG
ncbi:MAG: hypothetical protein WCF36_08785 [Candidatus Nanopelagicales bacterium]